MNLRNAENYLIGLDIGTNSVGWAVVDSKGQLYKFKGKNTWGSRIFDAAETAEKTRIARTLRRRYGRRSQRIRDLRMLMYSDIEKVDPDFFCRMNQSDLWLEDRDFSEPYVFFNSDDYTEVDYYKQFPTIYHLREHLVSSTKKEDIRLIYLAFHHMLKYRGHFLIEASLSAKSANSSEAIDLFLDELALYCDRNGLLYDEKSADKIAMANAVESSAESRRMRQESFFNALNLPASEKKKAKVFSDAVFGYEVNYSHIFEIDQTGETKFSLDKEEKVEKFEAEHLLEEDEGLFIALKNLRNAILLAGILRGAEGGTLSSSMVNFYEEHKKDLAELKRLIKEYFPTSKDGNNKTYYEVFRGPRYTDGTYKRKSASGYTAYILGTLSTEDFYKKLKDMFKDVNFSVDDRKYWDSVVSKMDEGVYLRKLRTSENGAIPHQLHLEEMREIISRQKEFYPTLQENGAKIEQLLSFRLPYYVGPLGKEDNPQRTKPFSWAVRKPGMENRTVKPWTFDDVVDRDESAEAFITNLIGECSYYLGKSVIPKNSLLYSEFCVRQELNVCKHDADGEKFTRMDNEMVQAIYENVFKRRKKVSVKDVETYLKSRFASHYKIQGTQKETEFASSLSSYCDFSKILGRPIDSYDDYEMVERIITWVTVFEDKKILQRKIATSYGPQGNNKLTEDQVKRICKLRYTGWSRLSQEFLEELRVEYLGRNISIMDVLRDSGKPTSMNLMEILSDKRFGFRVALEEKNREFLKDQKGYLLEEIPGSPAIKRGINQSLKIVEEIVSIAGKEPIRICVEMAREEVGKTKGSRTKSRSKNLEELYKAITNDMALYEGNGQLEKDLFRKKDDLDEERLYLYFLQRGKCAYSDEWLDIDSLSLYHVDHIVPQSFIKDDSFDNKVLVKRAENERKKDIYPLPEDLRKKNYAHWESLHEARLMSDKKFYNLTASQVHDRQAKGFINRQLVETRQISKHVVTILQSLYEDTTIEAVKAELSRDLRDQYGFYKVRSVNDWHHAHDAYLACQISRFLSERFPRIAEDLDYTSFSRFALATKDKKTGHSGLIANSFGINGFDPETREIFRDSWYGEKEVEAIRRSLNYKDCFVSRKVEKLTGEFWNQTVYSPRDKGGNMIPLKSDKQPEKYGYYTSPNSAYYSVIEHTETVRGKNKRKVSMVGIPVNASYRIKKEEDLLGYLESQFTDPRILKPQVLKYQKIKWGGAEYYLTSNSEMINARQLWLPRRYMKLLSKVEKKPLKKDCIDVETLDSLFHHLCFVVENDYPRYEGLAKKLQSDTCQNLYHSKSLEEKVQVIDELLNLLHCNAARGLKSLSLSSASGRMTNLPIGNFAEDITFIDSSVTGLFERNSCLEL